MSEQLADAYQEGMIASLEAIANGVPRWIETESGVFGQEIHPATGLPIATLSSPPELVERNQVFARGFNDSILRGIEAGEIAVDFRPLLMSLEEVRQAFVTHRLGVLSQDSPRIEEPSGRFRLRLQPPKKKSLAKRPPLIWIAIENASGLRDLKFMNYDGPVEVATGREGRVVLFQTDCLYISRDVETTQVLQRHLSR
jgi:hypothetical protein